MAANANNYIAAGTAAARSAVAIRNSLANTAPDYGAMGQAAVAEEARHVPIRLTRLVNSMTKKERCR